MERPIFENETITITFGEKAENHAGMQQIGFDVHDGFNYDDLLNIKKTFENNNYTCEMIKLNDALGDYYYSAAAAEAFVLIIRKGVNAFVKDIKELYLEQKSLEPDKKAYMYGRVVNKKARYNLCFSETSQEPDYLNKKGRIVSFSNVPLLASMRNKLHEFFGEKARDLQVEANYYYDISKCGIGYHGDGERKRVIGVRLGETIPLRFRWFYNNLKQGKDITIQLNDGDMYVMSEFATGYNWKKKYIFTLRHAAGCSKYID